VVQQKKPTHSSSLALKLVLDVHILFSLKMTAPWRPSLSLVLLLSCLENDLELISSMWLIFHHFCTFPRLIVFKIRPPFTYCHVGGLNS
jgi:hypothetical protein